MVFKQRKHGLNAENLLGNDLDTIIELGFTNQRESYDT